MKHSKPLFIIIALIGLYNNLTAGNVNFTSAKNKQNADMALISSKVWNDINNNGVLDANESGIAQVNVVLINNDNGAVVAETVTDANGNYSFTKIAPGKYVVAFSTPTGYQISPITAHTSNPTSKNIGGATETFTLTAGQFVTDLNSGFFTESTLGFNNK